MRKILFITILLFCFSFVLWADAFYDLSIKYPISMLGKGKITSYGATEYLRVDASNLSLQTLQANKDNNTSPGGEKAGIIYVAEFVAGGIGSLPAFVYSYLDAIFTERYRFNREDVEIITIWDAVVVGPLAWVTGKAFKQDGSLWKAMIGAGIGGLIGSLPWCTDSDSDPIVAMRMIGLSFAPLGAVIGFNL